MVEQGEADQIFYDPQHPYTRALLSATLFLDPQQKREKFHCRQTARQNAAAAQNGVEPEPANRHPRDHLPAGNQQSGGLPIQTESRLRIRA
ncbi:ABC transporter ATP-binding protein [Aquamicrobium soli]|uniref:Oligopeptide/dipeptide ABC transporter C-terminal domain-containing protein n=1 Tax=Aquamicrobium soli TaxID=1811518 RepID=A0ABV7K7V4_9HYPH